MLYTGLSTDFGDKMLKPYDGRIDDFPRVWDWLTDSMEFIAVMRLVYPDGKTLC